jgi:hypothetical protein
MKSTLLAIAATFATSFAYSQVKTGQNKIDTIWVTTNKTTTLLFPELIGKFDVGSEDFGAEKYLKTLTVKVASPESQPTSLLVIYGENIYHGTLAYKQYPKELFIDFNKFAPRNIPQFPNENRVQKINDSLKNLDVQMAEKRLNILLSDPKAGFKDVVDSKESNFLSLYNMMTDNEKVYLKILFINRSKLAYTIDFFEFNYRDPLQDSKLKGAYDTKPVYPIADNKIDAVGAKEERYFGFSIPKYSLSRDGELVVVVREKKGTRSMKITIPFRKILEAKTFSK